MADPAATDHPTRSSYHHGDLRAELIAAVRALVETHGPDGFSVAEAARRAGVSSAAPYKHFRDRPALLRAVAAAGMADLHARMAAAAADHAPGSPEAVTAIGQVYVAFARSGPGVFRLVFGLTEGHEQDADLQARGAACYGLLTGAVAACLARAPDDPVVVQRSYMLWTCVHGHSFLTIDRKTDGKVGVGDDLTFLRLVTQTVLGVAAGPPPG